MMCLTVTDVCVSVSRAQKVEHHISFSPNICCIHLILFMLLVILFFWDLFATFCFLFILVFYFVFKSGWDIWHIHISSFRIHNWGIEQHHRRDLEQQKQDVKSNCILETRETKSEVQPIITHSEMAKISEVDDSRLHQFKPQNMYLLAILWIQGVKWIQCVLWVVRAKPLWDM